MPLQPFLHEHAIDVLVYRLLEHRKLLRITRAEIEIARRHERELEALIASLSAGIELLGGVVPPDLGKEK